MGEKSRERYSIITSERPPGAANSEKCADQAGYEGKEDDKQKTKSSTIASCRLKVDFCQWERAVTGHHRVNVVDAIENSNAEEKRSWRSMLSVVDQR